MKRGLPLEMWRSQEVSFDLDLCGSLCLVWERLIGIRLLQGPWLSLNSIQTCLFTFYLFKHYRMFWKHLRTHFSIHWIPIKRSCPHHNPISSTNNMLSSRARLIKDHVHVFLSHIKSRRSVKRGESEGQATRNEKLFPLARWGIKLLQTSASLLTHPPACLVSLGWCKGKSTGNHVFSIKYRAFL